MLVRLVFWEAPLVHLQVVTFLHGHPSAPVCPNLTFLQVHKSFFNWGQLTWFHFTLVPSWKMLSAKQAHLRSWRPVQSITYEQRGRKGLVGIYLLFSALHIPFFLLSWWIPAQVFCSQHKVISLPFLEYWNKVLTRSWCLWGCMWGAATWPLPGCSGSCGPRLMVPWHSDLCFWPHGSFSVPDSLSYRDRGDFPVATRCSWIFSLSQDH